MCLLYPECQWKVYTRIDARMDSGIYKSSILESIEKFSQEYQLLKGKV